jgi:hypothetical protein
MVQPCEELWDWSWSCDVSNLQTMTIEIIIAFFLTIMAVLFSIIFYGLGKKDIKPIAEFNEIQADYQKRRIRQHLPDVIEKVMEMKSFFTETRELLKRDDCWDKIDDLIKVKERTDDHSFTFIFSREFQMKVFNAPQLEDYLKRKLEHIKKDMDPDLQKKNNRLGTVCW